MYIYVFFCFSAALTLSLRNNSISRYSDCNCFSYYWSKIRNVTEYHVFNIKFTLNVQFCISKYHFDIRISIFDIWTVTVIHVNPYKPSALSVGPRQTVETQIRYCRMRCLIRVSTGCLKHIYRKLNTNEKYHQTPLKFEIDSSYQWG